MALKIEIFEETHIVKGLPVDLAWQKIAPKSIPDFSCPIYKEIDKKTWEVKGSITGNVIGKITNISAREASR